MQHSDMSREQLLAELEAAHRLIAELKGAKAAAAFAPHEQGECDELYRAVIEDQTELICRLDANGTFLFANAIYSRFFGIDKEKLIGSTWHPRAVAEDIPMVEAHLSTLSPDNPVVFVENRVYDAAGDVRWMQFVNRGFFDESGVLRQIQSVGRDITKQRRLEAALVQRETDLARAQAISHLGSWAWEVEADLVSWSDETYRIFGVSPDTFIPSLEANAALVHEEDRPRLERWLNQALTYELMEPLDFRIVRPNGELRHIKAFCDVPEKHPVDNTTRLLGSVLDVTDMKRVEEHLRQRELDLAHAQAISHLGNWSWDLATDTVQWTDEMFRIFGVSPDTFTPTLEGIAALVHPEDLILQQQWLERALAGADLKPFDCRIVRPSGELRHVRVFGDSPGVDKPVKLTRVFGSVLDITDTKRAELALKESEERFRNIVQTANEGIWILDQYDITAYVNHTMAKMVGYEPEELIGRPGRDFLFPEDQQHFDARVHDRNCGRDSRYERRLRKKDGSAIWTIASTTPIFGKAGVPCGGFAMFTDITDRKLAEQALHDSEQRYQYAMEATSDGLWDWDVATDKTYFSPNYYRMLGYEPGEFPEYGESWIQRIHPEDKELALQLNSDCIENRIESFEVEFRMMTKSGAWKWILGRGKAVTRDASGKALRLIGTHLDISRRKHAEAELVRAKDQAIAATKAKSEFLANMSHEIRTPLNGVYGMLQVLRTTNLNQAQENYVGIALQSTKRLTQLLTDILDLSKVESGKLSLNENEFSLYDISRSITDIFGYLSAQKGIEFRFTIDTRLPVLLWGDDARLRQILLNLAGNAAKFTSFGQIRIEANLASQTDDGRVHVVFTVADTGCGIAEAQLEHIFDPFFQVNGSRPSSARGVGLGLAIVKRLSELMGGQASVKSVVGQGTVMRIELPFLLAKPATGRTTTCKVESPPVSGLNILVAEDDLASQLAVREMLALEGHRTVVAENGQDVLDLLTHQDFDLVFMDIQMPVLEGLETLHLIRGSKALGAKANIPIVAMTAYAMQGDREKFLQAGMNGYIAKPVELSDLRNAINEVFMGRS